MRPDERNPGAPGHRLPKPGGVEIVRRSRAAVQVVLSMPAGRPADRREVIGKARALLEQARQKEAAASRPSPLRKTQSAPGCGAWWAF